jgi:phage baseplate assembly protein W
MSPRRYLAWRFVHPDLVTAQAIASAGLQVSPQGRIETVEGDASVRQAIQLLLSTSPGERVMRPGYGCHLRRLVFSPNDDTTAGLAIHYVRQALERWEPRVDVLALDATRDPESPERLDISLHYRVRATNRTGLLAYPVELSGGMR